MMQLSARKRHIMFLTGTRADFGKLKPLMRAVADHARFEYSVFVTGMHTLRQYGYTANEVHKAGFENVHVYMNQHPGDHMEMVLANTVSGLSRFVREQRPDLLVVHGDRVECLAGAIVGALSNTLVAHVEGGERSGTVDELLRHSVSKLAHAHFVANDEAKLRLLQMGELAESVFVIGSPDVDAMMSDRLPAIHETRAHYGIDFDSYGILLYHPVTTDLANMAQNARAVVDGVIASRQNYVVVSPNNDAGSEHIFAQYERFEGNPRFRMFPSIAFEHFLTLLRHARFMIGNSSAGIREAPVYGVRSVNIGDRQASRCSCPSVIDVNHDPATIVAAVRRACAAGRARPRHMFGHGDSAARFMTTIENEVFWRTSRQKLFRDLPGVQAVAPLFSLASQA